MKFDVVIIGGGLSGLSCGISLQRSGLRCAIVSAGQNAMHFSSGAFELLSALPDGTPVDDPVAGMASLPAEHPYARIGAERFASLAGSLPQWFGSCGIRLSGDARCNGWRLTPSGALRRAAFALEEIELFPSPEVFRGVNVLIANVPGFLDFNTALLADGLERHGAHCRIVQEADAVAVDELERLRKNPSGMRSVHIARVLESPEVFSRVLEALRACLDTEDRPDALVLPAVFGLRSAVAPLIRDELGVPVHFVGTMPPSVPGVRAQLKLREAFESAGGTVLMGDSVVRTNVSDGRVAAVFTQNLGTTPLEAEHFVLATGGFFSKGLQASPDTISETVFGLDTDWTEGRESWYDTRFFAPQAYMRFGVHTDGRFRPSLEGRTLDNLRCIGSVLSGADSVREGSGAGIAILTALAVAHQIIGEE